MNEKECIPIIPFNKVFSIRLDGKNFSSVVKTLCKLNVFETKYSLVFENIMIELTKYVCTMFQNVEYVFTQSDEITIIINKLEIKNPIFDSKHDYKHEYSGRTSKFLSLAAGNISTKFYSLIVCHLIEQNLCTTELLQQLPNMAFDARIGIYDTMYDTFELILWRSYDCSVNGISQAIYLSDLPDKKSVRMLNTGKKLEYLNENNQLPLSNHQAYGTFIMRTMKEFTGEYNGEIKTYMRRSYEIVIGPVIRNVKERTFLISV
jgi:tRNA(His) 5'-end guanylyltransferase